MYVYGNAGNVCLERSVIKVRSIDDLIKCIATAVTPERPLLVSWLIELYIKNLSQVCVQKLFSEDSICRKNILTIISQVKASLIESAFSLFCIW